MNNVISMIKAPVDFVKEIEDLVEKLDIEYIDAVVLYCQRKNIEIETAAAIIDGNRAELTSEQYLEIADHIDQRRADVAEFLLKSRDKYVSKCHELGVEPVLPKDERANV